MKTSWMKARQTKYTAYRHRLHPGGHRALGLANWLANRYNKSVDTTANKQFSLSDQTIKIVSGLKQDVASPTSTRRDNFPRAKDLLDRYDTLSTKLHVDYIDPDKKPQLAKAAGIRNYGAIIIDAGPRHEEAKSLTEEEVTGAIIRTLKGGERTVCATSRQRRARTRRHRPRGLRQCEANHRAEQLQDPHHLAPREAGGPEGLHGVCSSVVPRFDYVAPGRYRDQDVRRGRRPRAVSAGCPRRSGKGAGCRKRRPRRAARRMGSHGE